MNDIVLLNLRISMWGVSRVLPDHEYEVDADKAMVRATKKILECPEYEFLLQLKRSIHRRLKTLALPGEILRAGVYPGITCPNQFRLLANHENHSSAAAMTMTSEGMTAPDGPITCNPPPMIMV
jgi:hypothetical protein